MSQRQADTLATRLNYRTNTLNFVRLILASGVILWHAVPLSGSHLTFTYGAQIVSQLRVDGFFALSGYLLTSSWLRWPQILPYVRNRLLRILPALWTCLIVVALIIAPLSTWIAGGDVRSLFTSHSSVWRFMTGNADTWMDQYGIAGTPRDVPVPGVWIGQLWTLRWEMLAYIGLAAMGILGILRRRWIVAALMALSWLAYLAVSLGLVPDNFWITRGTRLGMMFLVGATLFLFADRIPARWPWAASAFGVLLVAAALPDYRVLGAPALAYLIIWIGATVTTPRLRLKETDISYGLFLYDFPVQQLLAMAGLAALPAMVYGVVALVLTVPLAAASWFWLERPLMRRFKAHQVRARSSASLEPTALSAAAAEGSHAAQSTSTADPTGTADANNPVAPTGAMATSSAMEPTSTDQTSSAAAAPAHPSVTSGAMRQG